MRSEVIYLHEGRKDVTLTTYVLSDSPEMLAGKARPAVLICPGGAYLCCSDREGEPVAMQFAAMGYHAFVLRYSVYNEGWPGADGQRSDVRPKPQCRHPWPMLEIAMAMLLIRENAGQWHVDPDRIAICGFSAGAHNCAMYATNWHRPIVTEHFGRAAEDFRPAAAILGYTISDYLYKKERADLTDPGAEAMFAASDRSFLGTAAPDDDLLKTVSPAHNVTSYMPPAFLWATSEDKLVPVQQTLIMARALADQGIPFELHIFESGPHGLSVATQASAGALSEINRDAANWVELCGNWLMKRFAFDLPALNFFEKMQQKA